jgi:hypothetical protein
MEVVQICNIQSISRFADFMIAFHFMLDTVYLFQIYNIYKLRQRESFVYLSVRNTCTRLDQGPRLRMSGAISLLHPYTFIA